MKNDLQGTELTRLVKFGVKENLDEYRTVQYQYYCGIGSLLRSRVMKNEVASQGATVPSILLTMQ